MDPKQRMMRRDFDLNFDSGSLRAYTKTIDGKEVKFLGGTASSTAQDLYGDVIGPEAQVKMLQKLTALAEQMKDANSGLTGWLNHGYKLPEDCLGAFVSASLSTRTGDGINDEKGVEYIDLDIECRVTETNPRAVAAWEQVKDGIRHGWSIGCIFTEADWMSDDPKSPDYWTLYVTDLNLLEISLVGIPANQRAWCKNQDDLKAYAVKKAEEIVREAHATKSADRTLARDEAQRRGVILKSLMHVDDGVADTTTTSPITKGVEPAAQLELVTPPIDETKTALLSEEKTAGDPPAENVPAIDASDVAKQILGVDDASVSKLSAALNERAETSDAADLKALLEQASGAVSVLAAAVKSATAFAKRDPADGDGLDGNANVALAISHVAKAVGHGLCVRSAQHLAKALDCLSAAVGNVVDQPTPNGDGDQTDLSVTVEKLEPKAGDVIVFKAPDADRIQTLKQAIGDGLNDLGVKVLYLTESSVEIDNDLGTKAQQLTETTDALAAKQTELQTAETSLTEKQSTLAEVEQKTAAARDELTTLEAKIEEAKAQRAGRKSAAAIDFEARLHAKSGSDSEVKPEHYQTNAVEQRGKLEKQMSGSGAQPPTGRDMVATT